ncbi:hypothetical protein BU17DRAFT_91333 [Hysterangium stoloniferum]|nr:hypothetical protein BU17DRAFT_91333 [Hysterangium stoloniferum]
MTDIQTQSQRKPRLNPLLWAHLRPPSNTGNDSSQALPFPSLPLVPENKINTSLRVVFHDTKCTLEQFSDRLGKLLASTDAAKCEMDKANKNFDTGHEKILEELNATVNRSQRGLLEAIANPAQADVLDGVKSFQIEINRKLELLETRVDYVHKHLQTIVDQQGQILTILASITPLLPLLKDSPQQLTQILSLLLPIPAVLQAFPDHIKVIQKDAVDSILKSCAYAPERQSAYHLQNTCKTTLRQGSFPVVNNTSSGCHSSPFVSATYSSVIEEETDSSSRPLKRPRPNAATRSKDTSSTANIHAGYKERSPIQDQIQNLTNEKHVEVANTINNDACSAHNKSLLSPSDRNVTPPLILDKSVPCGGSETPRHNSDSMRREVVGRSDISSVSMATKLHLLCCLVLMLGVYFETRPLTTQKISSTPRTRSFRTPALPSSRNQSLPIDSKNAGSSTRFLEPHAISRNKSMADIGSDSSGSTKRTLEPKPTATSVQLGPQSTKDHSHSRPTQKIFTRANTLQSAGPVLGSCISSNSGRDNATGGEADKATDEKAPTKGSWSSFLIPSYNKMNMLHSERYLGASSSPSPPVSKRQQRILLADADEDVEIDLDWGDMS